jgi:YbbR domain-containing protein
MKEKILYLLISVVVAFGLWSYVITTDSPEWEETYYEIPVILKNESVLHGNGLMLDDDKIPSVTLRLKGNRSDLLKLNKSNITLVADLSRIYESGKQSVAYTIAYPGDVPPNSIEILEQSPREIQLSILERHTKDVDIEIVYNGSVPEGFRTDKENVLLDREAIRVVGPASVVDRIASAQIQVDLAGQTGTINSSYRYVLLDREGKQIDPAQLTVDAEEVELTLKIQRYKEIKLLLNVIPGGGANESNTNIKPDMQTIQVSGTQQLLDSLGDTLEFEIRLGEIMDNTTKQFEIKLPEGVENLSGKSILTVDIIFPELVTRTFQVTNLRTKNVPAGMTAELLTQALTVTIRGAAAQVRALNADDLSVIVDMSGAELGTDSYRATVDTGRFISIGAVGSYSVDVRVTAEDSEG